MEKEILEKKKKLEQHKPDNEKGSADKVNFHHTINFHSSFSIQVFSFTKCLVVRRAFLDLKFGFNFTTIEDLAEHSKQMNPVNDCLLSLSCAET